MTQFSEPLDPDVYSDQCLWVSDDSEFGGHLEPIKWREVALESAQEVKRLRGFQQIIADLDRNEHGRHEGDIDCGDRSGISQGNPRLWSDRVIGYDISGRPYIMPEQGRRNDPEAWKGE
jgi:hypothetical protein